MKNLLLFGTGLILLIAIALSLQPKPKVSTAAIDNAAILASRFSDTSTAVSAKHRANPPQEESVKDERPWEPKEGEKSIRGLTVAAYNHMQANEILHNNRINDPAMQAILRALITNDIPMGYCTPLYNDLKMASRLKGYANRDPGRADTHKAKMASLPERYSSSTGISGMPPIPEEKQSVIQDLFNNAPAPLNFTNQCWPPGFSNGDIHPDANTPVDQWYKPGDVLQYIREHPGQANAPELPYPNQVTPPLTDPSGGN